MVSGEKGGRDKKHFHGEGGKVWDSASSGSQRRTNNFNDNSSFYSSKRGASISNDLVICHALSYIVDRSIRNSRWRPMERKRAFSKETRKKKRNSYDSYLFFLLLFTRDCHDCSILLHPSQPVLVATDFRLPPPSSSVIAIAVTTHNGNRTCCVSPFVACESRERFLCSNGTQDRRGYIVHCYCYYDER